jgi:hypothetical protein
MSMPLFYFSTIQENPKRNVQIQLKTIQPNIDYMSNVSMVVNIDNKDYLLDLNIVINFEPSANPNVNITHNVTPLVTSLPKTETGPITMEIKNSEGADSTIIQNIIQNIEPQIKEVIDAKDNPKSLDKLSPEIKGPVSNLISFMVELKSKLKKEVEEESKLLKELQDKKLEEESKLLENSLILENKKLIQVHLRNKQLEREMERESDKSSVTTIRDIEEKLNPIENYMNNKNNGEPNISPNLEVFKQKYNIKTPDEVIKNYKTSTVVPTTRVTNADELKLEQEIYDHLVQLISGDKSTIYTNLVYIITELMKFVQNYEADEDDKKDLIISSIKLFLKNENLDSPETDIILDTVCPELINILTLVDQRKIIIKSKIKCLPFL